MENFILVLFKNKKKKKIIKGYSTEKNALNKYNELLKENKDVDFEVFYENGERVKYEIAILSRKDEYQLPLYKTDSIGRNESVFLSDDSDYVIKKINDFKKQELIYDWQTKNRITFTDILNKYCDKKTIKLISSLHNKIVIQVEDLFYLFSLKNSEESERFMQYMENYFISNKRLDSIFVRDMNTTQRKWMYDILEKNGFDKNKLYKQYTTFSKRSSN